MAQQLQVQQCGHAQSPLNEDVQSKPTNSGSCVAFCSSLRECAMSAFELAAGSNEGDLLELYCGNGNFTQAVAPNFRKVCFCSSLVGLGLAGKNGPRRSRVFARCGVIAKGPCSPCSPVRFLTHNLGSNSSHSGGCHGAEQAGRGGGQAQL